MIQAQSGPPSTHLCLSLRMPQLLLVLLCLALTGHQAFGQTDSADPPRRRVDHFLAQLAAVSTPDGVDPHAGHQHDRGFSKYRRQPSLLDLVHQPETRAGTKGSPSPLPFAGVDAQKKSAIVDVIASGVTCGESLQKALTDLGFKMTGAWGRVCSGWLPLDKVDEVEGLAGINFVRTCLVTTQRGVTGRVESEGRLAIRAGPNDLKRLPYDGTGVTVGVLSDSFDTSPDAATRMADDVASGDLPGPDKLRIVYEEPIELSDEGRAMAQIVHDVAPGADIEFHSVSGGQAAFAAGIERLAETCQVIVDDVSYLDEPMFMDGIIGKAVDKAVQNGVVFVSAAGNQGHASYEDTFTPGPSFARHVFGQEFLGGIAHTFDGVSNQRIVMRPGSTLALTMQWAQPFFSEGGPGSNTDYDMYLLHDDDGDGRPDSLLSSATDNSIGSDPIETLWYHNGEGKTVTVFLMILHRHHQVHPPKSAPPTNNTNTGGLRGVGEGDGEEEEGEVTFSSDGPPPPHPMGWIDGAAGERIKYVDFGNVHLNEASASSQAGTLYGHRNARGSITVGSAYYKQTPAFGRSPPVANTRSSVGGVPVWREGVWEESTKPDVVGPDGVSTTFFPRKSAPYFFGTSAAAPHVAAVAALMLQADPSLAPEDIRRILVETAVDMREEDISAIDRGFDSHTGNGMVDAAAALRKVLGMEQEAPSPPYVTGNNEERPWGTIGIVLGATFGVMAIVAIGTAVFFYKRHKEAQAEQDVEMPRRPTGAKPTGKLRIFDSKRYAHLRNSVSDMSLSQSDSAMLSPHSPLTPNSMTMSSTGDFEMSPFFWHRSSQSTNFEPATPSTFPKSSCDPISPLSSEVATPASIPQRRGAFLSPTGLDLPLATSGDINVILTAPTPKNINLGS